MIDPRIHEMLARRYAEADDGQHADWSDANYRRDRMKCMEIALLALEDEGLVVVPKHATPGMVEAGGKSRIHRGSLQVRALRVYRAMIAEAEAVNEG